MNNFHNTLKKALKERHISQTALARALNVSQASVWEWLNTGFPSVERLCQICEYAKISPNTLLGFEEIDE